MAGTVTLALAVICAGFALAQDGPPGDAFYTPPAKAGPGEPGSLIWMRPLTNSAALPGAARNLLVLYRSRDGEGREIAVSGTVAIPAGTPPPGGWPLLTWTHGTAGLGPACAPSRDTPDGPEHAFLAQKQALLDGYVRRGYAVVATDYPGLGAPGLHPFLQGAPAARSALDIMRAARGIDPQIGSRYVVMGHSQGGHADLFTAASGPAYAPEFELLGNVAFAPASHIAATVEAMATATSPALALGYAMYVLQSYASNHPKIDLAAILTPAATANLPETRRRCISATVTSGYWATAIPKDQFRPGADLAPVVAVATANDPGALTIKAPTFVAQGTADDTVLPRWTDEVARALCRGGANLLYKTYPGADHETVVDRAATEASAWIAARFAGQAARGNCDALPAAAPARP